jgi:DNA repair protein RadC
MRQKTKAKTTPQAKKKTSIFLIICHNHPSGNTEPSPQDIQITTAIKNAAKLFDIKLIDSIIISSFNYYSFLESGLI